MSKRPSDEEIIEVLKSARETTLSKAMALGGDRSGAVKREIERIDCAIETLRLRTPTPPRLTEAQRARVEDVRDMRKNVESAPDRATDYANRGDYVAAQFTQEDAAIDRAKLGTEGIDDLLEILDTLTGGRP